MANVKATYVFLACMPIRIAYVFFLFLERARFKFKNIDRILDRWSIRHGVQVAEDDQDAILLNARLVIWDMIDPLLMFVYFYEFRS